MNPLDVAEWIKLNSWEIENQTASQMVFSKKGVKYKIYLPLTLEKLSGSMLDAILRKAGIKI